MHLTAKDIAAVLSGSDAIALSSMIVSIPSAIATIIGAIISYYGFKQFQNLSETPGMYTTFVRSVKLLTTPLQRKVLPYFLFTSSQVARMFPIRVQQRSKFELEAPDDDQSFLLLTRLRHCVLRINRKE